MGRYIWNYYNSTNWSQGNKRMIYIYIYILNFADTKRLKHGFRYVKELLLQNHNLRMYKDRQTLTINNINVYPVKADALQLMLII